MREVGTIIVGGGISGATALHRIASAGEDVLLLERGGKLGGVIDSERNGLGALIERGPNSLQSGNEFLERLISELDLTDRIVEADAAAAKRFIVRDGKLVPMPTSPRAFVETPLLSGRAKLRVLREIFIGPARAEREESVAEFVRRRLGREPLDYGVSPFVSGIYAGRAEDLSLIHTFPIMHELEQKHGSLIRGAIRRAKERRRNRITGDGAAKRRRMFSFREGLGSLPASMEERWRDRIVTDATVERIAPDESGWNVRAGVNGSEESFRAKNVIVATSAYAAADLLGAIDPDLADALRRVYYPPLAVASLVFDRADVGHPLDGFGFLCPEVEGRRVLGVIFSSTVFPSRVKPGDVLLTAFVGGARNPEAALASHEEIEGDVREELTALLGVTGPPRSVDMSVWEKAIPQYTLGYSNILEAIDSAEKRHAGLHLLGNYRGGVSVPDCVRSGWKLAEEIVEVRS